MTTAKKLAALRKKAGLSVDQLAEAAKVARPTVYAIENGTRKPSLEIARKLCRALNASLAVFD